MIILTISFLHNFAFTAGTFYLALFFQVRSTSVSYSPVSAAVTASQAAGGLSPLEAGVRLLPYSLGSSLASMPVAWFIGYWQRRSHSTVSQNWVITSGLFVSTLGFGESRHLHLCDSTEPRIGLMILMREDSPAVLQGLFPLVAGIGLGMLFHAPYQVFSRALKPCELATGTSAFFLVRFTGATIGLVGYFGK